MFSSFSLSPASILPTGIPVHAETTSAISAAETSSETMGLVACSASVA